MDNKNIVQLEFTDEMIGKLEILAKIYGFSVSEICVFFVGGFLSENFFKFFEKKINSPSIKKTNDSNSTNYTSVDTVKEKYINTDTNSNTTVNINTEEPLSTARLLNTHSVLNTHGGCNNSNSDSSVFDGSEAYSYDNDDVSEITDEEKGYLRRQMVKKRNTFVTIGNAKLCVLTSLPLETVLRYPLDNFDAFEAILRANSGVNLKTVDLLKYFIEFVVDKTASGDIKKPFVDFWQHFINWLNVKLRKKESPKLVKAPRYWSNVIQLYEEGIIMDEKEKEIVKGMIRFSK
jgi:hypothetical protein